MTGPTLQANPNLHWRQLPHLDPNTVAHWRQNLPEPALREIYGAFLQQTTQRVHGLRQGATGDPKLFSSAVHAIAGSAGMLGAVRLEAACRDARAQIAQGTLAPHTLEELTGEVEQELAEVESVLRGEGLAA